MGGKDKGAPYAPLIPLLKDRVREVLLIGAAADRIAHELSGAVELVRAGNLETAVPEAFQRARPGDVVLLAPACSSFDQFQDYEHRGRVFKELVGRLAQDVESGSVEWKWTKREKPGRALPVTAPAQAGSTVSPQVKAQPHAESPQIAPRATVEPEAHVSAPEIEETIQQVSELVYEESSRSTEPTLETPPHELTLVYEISADEYAPIDVMDEDYSELPETSQSPTVVEPERIESAPLPYEGRVAEKGLAGSGSTEGDASEGGTKEIAGASEGNSRSAADGKLKSADPDQAAQLRLPRMD
jgi:hypothetical protein